jgi:hypothetical protein
MGHQPLSAAAAVRLAERHRRYAAHDDAAAAVANFVALVIAWNGPFYPLYVALLTGWDRLVLLTLPATPLFFLVPLAMRWSSRLGRAALPLIGTVNTLWCTKLLGAVSAVGLFLMPCVLLAALLFRRGERAWMLVAAGLPLAAALLPDTIFGAPLLRLAPDQEARLAALNFVSAAMLSGLLAWQFAGLLANYDAGGPMSGSRDQSSP